MSFIKMGSVTNEVLAQVTLKLAPYNYILRSLLMDFKLKLNKRHVAGAKI